MSFESQQSVRILLLLLLVVCYLKQMEEGVRLWLR